MLFSRHRRNVSARTSARESGASRVERAAGCSMSMDCLEARVVLAAVSWDGGGGNNLWSNPLNWSNDLLPGNADDVTIDVPSVQRTIVADEASGVIRVRSLTLSDTLVTNRGVNFNVNQEFNITASGQIRINGLVNWVAGEWASTVDARLNPGGQLNIGSSQNPTQGSVTLNTNLISNARFGWRGGTIFLNEGFTLTNSPTKAMDLSSPLDIEPSLGQDGGQIVNNGILRRGGDANGDTGVEVSLVNNDRIRVLRGQLTLQHNNDDNVFPQFTNSGSTQLNAASSVLEVNMVAVHDEATFFGPGSVRLQSVATLQNESGTTFRGDTAFNAGSTMLTSVPAVRIHADGATFTGTLTTTDVGVTLGGNLSIEGTVNGSMLIFGAGELTVSGTLQLGAIGSIRVPTTILSGGEIILGTAQTFSDSGFTDSVRVEGTLTLRNGTLVIAENGGEIDIAEGGLFLIESLGTTVGEPGQGIGPGEITNAGTIRYVGDGDSALSWGVPLTNTGTVEIDDGTIEYSGNFTNGGTLSLSDTGNLEVDGDFTNADGADVIFSITSGSFGTVTATGAVAIEGGTLTANFVGGGFAAGQNRTLFTGASRTGTFGTVTASGLVGLNASAQYNATNIVLQLTV